MKNLISTILTISVVILGGSLILFILRSIWGPPGEMGMMMRRGAMYHHMGMWMQGTLFMLISIFIVIFIIWLLKDLFKR